MSSNEMEKRWTDRERDIERELRLHLELEAAEQEGNGRSPEEALFAAQRQLGDMAFLQDEIRTVWAVQWFDRNVALAFLVVCTVALGIVANAAAYRVLNEVLVPPPPAASAVAAPLPYGHGSVSHGVVSDCKHARVSRNSFEHVAAS